MRYRSSRRCAAVLAALVASYGASQALQRPTRHAGRRPMDSIAQQYVRTVLALGQHDADYVDAYYGPPEWKTEAARSKLDLPAIGEQAAQLRRELKKVTPPADELSRLRWEYL